MADVNGLAKKRHGLNMISQSKRPLYESVVTRVTLNVASPPANSLAQMIIPVPKCNSTSVKIDQNDIRATQHYMKKIEKDGKTSKVWECGICQKEFKYQYTLVRHIPTHTDVRNFQCTVCQKSFRQMSTLAQHKATHLNTRPFSCDICSKAFNRVSTLISHKRIHTNEKKHVCSMCGKGFHQKGNLKNHLYTHTNERPYKCTYCDKGFNQKSNLVVHQNSTHFKNTGTCLKPKGQVAFSNSRINNHRRPSTVNRKTRRNNSSRLSQPLSNNKEHLRLSRKQEEVKNSGNSSVNNSSSTPGVVGSLQKIPSLSMVELFERGKTPFVLFSKWGEKFPVLCKVMKAEDHYLLIKPSDEDIANYKCGDEYSSLAPLIVADISEVPENGQMDYVIKPEFGQYFLITEKQIKEEKDQSKVIAEKRSQAIDVVPPIMHIKQEKEMEGPTGYVDIWSDAASEIPQFSEEDDTLEVDFDFLNSGHEGATIEHNFLELFDEDKNETSDTIQVNDVLWGTGVKLRASHCNIKSEVDQDIGECSDY